MLKILVKQYKRAVLIVTITIVLLQLASLYLYNFAINAPFFLEIHNLITAFNFVLFIAVPFILTFSVYRRGIKIGNLTGQGIGLRVNALLVLAFLPFEIADLAIKAVLSLLSYRALWIFCLGSLGGAIILLLIGIIFGKIAEAVAER